MNWMRESNQLDKSKILIIFSFSDRKNGSGIQKLYQRIMFENGRNCTFSYIFRGMSCFYVL